MLKKFETVIANTVTRGSDANGDPTTTLTPFFTATAHIQDVSNSLELQDKYRLVGEYTHIILNYTPNTYSMADQQSGFAFTWRNKQWRILDGFESADRTTIDFLCFRADPSTRV